MNNISGYIFVKGILKFVQVIYRVLCIYFQILLIVQRYNKKLNSLNMRARGFFV